MHVHTCMYTNTHDGKTSECNLPDGKFFFCKYPGSIWIDVEECQKGLTCVNEKEHDVTGP